MIHNESEGDAVASSVSPSVGQAWPRDRPSSVEIGLEDDKLMTGSYSEIVDEPWDSTSQELQKIEEDNSESLREDDVDLLTPICEDYNPSQSFMVEDRINAFMRLNVAAECDQDQQSVECASEKETSETLCPEEMSKKIQLQDTEPDSDYFHFVSQEWLDKLSSNISAAQKANEPSSCSTVPNLLRSTLQPMIPLVDPTIIHDIEAHARNIATSMDTLIESLTGILHSISSLTVDCVETYCVAVCKTCDAVDSNIKSMYQLMAKCEELSKSMAPMYKLHDQIKEIRRLLDLFESIVFASTS